MLLRQVRKADVPTKTWMCVRCVICGVSCTSYGCARCVICVIWVSQMCYAGVSGNSYICVGGFSARHIWGCGRCIVRVCHVYRVCHADVRLVLWGYDIQVCRASSVLCKCDFFIGKKLITLVIYKMFPVSHTDDTSTTYLTHIDHSTDTHLRKTWLYSSCDVLTSTNWSSINLGRSSLSCINIRGIWRKNLIWFLDFYYICTPGFMLYLSPSSDNT